MSVRKTLLMLAALAGFAAAGSTPATAAGWRFGYLPQCENGWALATIRYQFAQKEGRFWNSGLRIAGFDRIRETAYHPWARETIPRRFCSGYALVSDGRVRPVHYSIAENLGMAGMGFGVTWCVVGLDRNWAYNPSCRAAKP